MTTHNNNLPPGSSPEADSPQQQVTIAEAAKRLSFGKRTVYRMVQTGELASIGRGRLRRIAVEDIRAWQARNRNGGE